MEQNIETRVEIITPEVAKEYLTHNCVNRSLSPNRIKTYATDMKNGNWELNGEAIQFNKSGELINGQHRLNAIIRANVPVTMLVMRGLSNDLTLFDRGRNRSVRDSLIISGMDKRIATPITVAMAKIHYYIQIRNNVVSDFEVKKFIEKYENTLYKMVNASIMSNYHKYSGTISVTAGSIQLAIMYALECGVSIDVCKKFLDIVRTGFYDEITQSAAIVLRNDLISKKIDIRGGTDARADACIKIENALGDFVRHYPRKNSYSNSNCKPIYSNNVKFKE